MVSPFQQLYSNAPSAVQKLGSATEPIPCQPWEVFQIIDGALLCPDVLKWKKGFQSGLFLPYILLPYIGAAVFLVICDREFAQMLRSRWFQLSKLSKGDIAAAHQQSLAANAGFGASAMLLEMIPGLSFVLVITNTIAMVLWALETKRRNKRMSTSSEAVEKCNQSNLEKN